MSTSTTRPVVRRTYGRAASTSSAGAVSSLATRVASTLAPETQASSSSSPPASSSWSRTGTDSSSSGGLPQRATSHTALETPPTSPEAFSNSERKRVGSSSPQQQQRQQAHQQQKQKQPKRDLRAFFGVLSPSRRTNDTGSSSSASSSSNKGKRKVVARRGEPLEDDDEHASPRKSPRLASNFTASTSAGASGGVDAGAVPGSSDSVLSSSSPASKRRHRADKDKSKPRKKKATLEQLYLDPFETAPRSKSSLGNDRGTLHCATCGLSYARTPDDMLLHDKHHKRVTTGVTWLSKSASARTGSGGANGGQIELIDACVEIRGAGGGDASIYMFDAVQDGALGRKVNEVLKTVDDELAAAPLEDSQLRASKVLVAVSHRSNKVVACAVVQRIKEAYQIVRENGKKTDEADGFVRVGEGDSAVFCSPEPQSAVLGVHRIWTSASHRRNGLATALLDAVAARAAYGYPIPQERRKVDVAFSQPTGKGSALATWWTGTSEFKVFI